MKEQEREREREREKIGWERLAKERSSRGETGSISVFHR